MRVFTKLRALADYQRRHLPEMRTPEDHELVREIGHHQVLGAPLTLKQVTLLGIGSAATAQRRLGRLKRLGLVRGRRSHGDGRVVELTLSPACMRAFSRLEGVLAGADARPAPAAGARPRHACALCNGDAHGFDAMLRFLRQGAARDRLGVFLGPGRLAAKAKSAAAGARSRRGRLVVSDGFADVRATIALLAAQFARAHAEGKQPRVAIHAGWAIERQLPVEAILRVEDEVRHLVDRYGGEVLCVFDARTFSGPRLLELLKAHGDGRSVSLEIA
ncbi:MAG TPA: MEDS domain-containing protein [Usitatibacter sp.]|nr:MEDS domain-containing protein [Usitatibacter sp.]